MALCVVDSGPREAEPVVFLHGAAASGWMWRPQTRELSADLRCLVVDLPGHGESADTAWESLDDAAERVAEIIRTTTGGRASVVGISLGGCVAVRLALREPDLLAGVIVSGVSVHPASLGVRMWQRGQLIARYTAFRRLVSSGDRVVGGADADVPAPRQPVRPLPLQTLTKIADEVVGFELPESPRRIACPLLAVAGEHESREVLTSLRPLAERFEPGWAKYVPDAGHGWNAERPELFNAMVHSWVSARRLPPRLHDPEQWAGSD